MLVRAYLVGQAGGGVPQGDGNVVYSMRIPSVSSERAEAIIRDMVQRIVSTFDPDMVILFGSYASGQPGPESDVDLLIVMPVDSSRRAMAARIDAALAGRELPVDILVATPDDIRRKRDVVGTIIYPALREGRVLYERAA